MHICLKCGDFYADQQLVFCLTDGTPLISVDPNTDTWNKAARVLEGKENALRKQNRKLKWRRVMLRAMLMTTLVVSVAAARRSIFVTVDPPQGELCIATFNDRNGDGVQDQGEPGLSGLIFQVRGTDPAKPLTADLEAGVCSVLPVGTYTVAPQDGWIATTPTTQTVTVTAGQAANVLVGSKQETSKLCVGTFDDLNGNGVQDAGEAGASGFDFQISGAVAVTTLTTGPNGGGCAVLPVGKYTVVQQPREGWIATTPTTQTVTVTAGQAANALFGSRQEGGKLCIRTFDDSNSNRLQDAGEVGLSGFVFQVHGTAHTITLTTDSDGVCSDLPIGTYTVVEQPLRGWVATTPTTQRVIVTAGQTASLLFGSRRETGKLCVATFDDRNGDGLRDAGEPVLSGFVFEVRGTDDAKTLTTDLRGGICSVLPVGAYTVVEQPQGGWIATTPTTHSVTVTADQTANVSFGSRRETAKLCIGTFDDVNGNGSQDEGEAGLSGFVFEVSGTDLVKTLTTKPKARRICSVLPVGAYTVVEQPREGWIATTATKQTVTVSAGQGADVSFGSRRAIGKLCISAFNDSNSNREQDKGEPALSGFVFEVRGPEFSKTLTSDSKGAVCSDLPVGKYTVVERPQAGWIATTGTKQTVSITAGEAVNVSFGSRQGTGKLCITPFDDLNRNGERDKGEPGLSGFVFEVHGTDSAKLTLTTESQLSVCSELPVGTYTVAETPKPGWTATNATKQTVIVTANQANSLFFGNTKSEPECSDADKSRERQIILVQYQDDWRKSIESEQEKVIAETAPNANGKVRARLEEFKPQFDLPTCTRAFVAIKYVWVIEVLGGGEKARTERVRGERTYHCQQMSGNWICRKAHP